MTGETVYPKPVRRWLPMPAARAQLRELLPEGLVDPSGCLWFRDGESRAATQADSYPITVVPARQSHRKIRFLPRRARISAQSPADRRRRDRMSESRCAVLQLV